MLGVYNLEENVAYKIVWIVKPLYKLRVLRPTLFAVRVSCTVLHIETIQGKAGQYTKCIAPSGENIVV